MFFPINHHCIKSHDVVKYNLKNQCGVKAMDMYLEIKRLFEEKRDVENASKMSAYMRGMFLFYGLPTPKRRAVYKGFLKSEKQAKAVNWNFLDK